MANLSDYTDTTVDKNPMHYKFSFDTKKQRHKMTAKIEGCNVIFYGVTQEDCINKLRAYITPQVDPDN